MFINSLRRLLTIMLVAACASGANAGMVTFFDIPDLRGTCPEGWSEYIPAKGRLIQGTSDPSQVGETLGTAMQDKTAPTHTHTFNANVTLPYEPVVANGGGNSSLTAADTPHSAQGESEPSDGNIPYMQMLGCEQISGFPAEQALPKEMVAFFSDATCPADWEYYEKLDGRFALPVPPDARSSEFNRTVGPWGSNSMDHDHYMYISDAASHERVYLPLENASVVLAKSWWPFKANKSWGRWKFKDQFSRTSNSGGKAVPRVRLLPCIKVGGRARTSMLPIDMTSFMAAQDCPKHWRQKPASAGRFLVGLPEGQYALSGQTFGGNPLSSLEVREHTHDVNGSIEFKPLNIGGASGAGADGYAHSGTYTLQGKLVSTINTLPYVQMRHCIVTTMAKNQTASN